MTCGIGHGGAVGKPGSPTSLNPTSNGDGKGGIADTPSVSCSALLSGTLAKGKILDLDAVDVAARRSTRSGSSGPSHESTPPHHPRNRFAPMAENELERFLLQPWSDDFVGKINTV